jgi:hypothetical protein
VFLLLEVKDKNVQGQATQALKLPFKTFLEFQFLIHMTAEQKF